MKKTRLESLTNINKILLGDPTSLPKILKENLDNDVHITSLVIDGIFAGQLLSLIVTGIKVDEVLNFSSDEQGIYNQILECIESASGTNSTLPKKEDLTLFKIINTIITHLTTAIEELHQEVIPTNSAFKTNLTKIFGAILNHNFICNSSLPFLFSKTDIDLGKFRTYFSVPLAQLDLNSLFLQIPSESYSESEILAIQTELMTLKEILALQPYFFSDSTVFSLKEKIETAKVNFKFLEAKMFVKQYEHIQLSLNICNFLNLPEAETNSASLERLTNNMKQYENTCNEILRKFNLSSKEVREYKRNEEETSLNPRHKLVSDLKLVDELTQNFIKEVTPTIDRIQKRLTPPNKVEILKTALGEAFGSRITLNFFLKGGSLLSQRSASSSSTTSTTTTSVLLSSPITNTLQEEEKEEKTLIAGRAETSNPSSTFTSTSSIENYSSEVKSPPPPPPHYLRSQSIVGTTTPNSPSKLKDDPIPAEAETNNSSSSTPDTSSIGSPISDGKQQPPPPPSRHLRSQSIVGTTTSNSSNELSSSGLTSSQSFFNSSSSSSSSASITSTTVSPARLYRGSSVISIASKFQSSPSPTAPLKGPAPKPFIGDSQTYKNLQSNLSSKFNPLMLKPKNKDETPQGTSQSSTSSSTFSTSSSSSGGR